MADPISLVAGKSDAVLADEFRKELTPAMDKAAEIIDRAKKSGLSITFNIGPDNYGRIVTKEITVVKPL